MGFFLLVIFFQFPIAIVYKAFKLHLHDPQVKTVLKILQVHTLAIDLYLFLLSSSHILAIVYTHCFQKFQASSSRLSIQ